MSLFGPFDLLRHVLRKIVRVGSFLATAQVEELVRLSIDSVVKHHLGARPRLDWPIRKIVVGELAIRFLRLVRVDVLIRHLEAGRRLNDDVDLLVHQ